MIVFVKIDPTTGNGLGPNFVITSNFGSVTPGTATRNELLAGIYVIANDSATKIKVTSQGNCTNSFEVNIFNLPPTTTTTSTTTISCNFTGGGSAFFASQAPPTTTSTTTQAPIGKITISPVNIDGAIGIYVAKTQGLNPNALTFTGTAVQHTNTTCSNIAGTHNFTITLNANASANSILILTATPGLPRMKITSLTINGTIVISTSPQTITVGGNNYLITGYNVCANT